MDILGHPPPPFSPPIERNIYIIYVYNTLVIKEQRHMDYFNSLNLPSIYIYIIYVHSSMLYEWFTFELCKRGENLWMLYVRNSICIVQYTLGVPKYLAYKVNVENCQLRSWMKYYIPLKVYWAKKQVISRKKKLSSNSRTKDFYLDYKKWKNQLHLRAKTLL